LKDKKTIDQDLVQLIFWIDPEWKEDEPIMQYEEKANFIDCLTRRSYHDPSTSEWKLEKPKDWTKLELPFVRTSCFEFDLMLGGFGLHLPIFDPRRCLDIRLDRNQEVLLYARENTLDTMVMAS
jgi:hypothetical protein